MQSADIRGLFPGLRGTIYLNTASVNVGCTPAREAYERAVEQWSEGHFDWAEAEHAGEDARAAFAGIVSASPSEIAIVPSVSMAAGIVAANLPLAARGENVVVAGNEFSSNYFSWLLLRERGYDVRVLSTGKDGVSAEEFARAADAGTRLIAVSAVHSATGYQTNLRAISEVARTSGAWFFVDACQAAGAVPLDVIREDVDFLAASSHKFLLGSRGMGYLYVRRELLEQIHPVGPGWKAARKPLESFYGPAMDLSTTASKLDASLAWFPAMADQAALGIFRRFGTDALLERNTHLAAYLHDALTAEGLSFYPRSAESRSTIFSVQTDDPETILAKFKQSNVVASVRSGRVRLAVHFYNLEEELSQVAEIVGGP